MKTVSSELQAHFGLDCTTLALLFKAKRPDGKVFGFTTFDQDIVFDIGDGDGSITYLADTGITNTARANKDDLSVDNSEVTGFLDSVVIVEDEIRAGLWNNAELKLAIVNWADLTQGCLKLDKNSTGNIQLQNGLFRSEVRGLAQKLTAQIVYSYGPLCRAELGSGIDYSTISRTLDTVDGSSYGYSFAIGIRAGKVPVGANRIKLTLKSRHSPDKALSVASLVIQKVLAGAVAGDPIVDTVHFKVSGSNTFTVPAGGESTTDWASVLFDGAYDYYIVIFTNDAAADGIMKVTIPNTHGQEIFCTNVVLGDQTGVSTLTSWPDDTTTNWRVFSAITFDPPSFIDSGTTWECGVNIVAYQQAGSVDSSADRLTITPAAGLKMVGSGTPLVAAPAGWFNDGVLRFTSGAMKGFSIEVKEWDGTVITTFLPMPYQPLNGDTFIIEPGCDKTSGLSGCKKFANIVNFRGEEFIPGPMVTMNYPDAK